MRASEKLNSVHFMRFFAAMAVVVHHVTTGFGNKRVMVGAAGVDVFFVISGIVIGMSLLREEAPYNFAVKRMIRVLPLYWIATAASVLFVYSTWGELPTTEELARSLLLWPKFGTDWHAIYFPAWTLTYEMLFYCVAGAILVASRKHAWTATLVIFTLIGLFRIPVPGTDGAFFSTAVCLEFCMGLAIAPLIVCGWRPSTFAGIAMIAIGAIFAWSYQDDVLLITEQASRAHLARPLQLGLPCALIVAGMLAFDSASWMREKVIELGGDASYAIYVTHITTINFVSDRLLRHGIDPKGHPVTMQIALIVLSLGVGVCTRLFVERPLLDYLRNLLLGRSTRAVTVA
ncbi:acyltransferase [Paraburkholderia guartelaensis]|uniref:Acyltransferase n=1 Tax=Paraburkholderia guartelaensis TaxID=2546446 RepID=A0A4V2ZWN7_9BURK|nr:acyltransferase [Paraburkholderia guartelaensis]TDG10573.1 acyltransferase [Paraburkholderia guartelaensis]